MKTGGNILIRGVASTVIAFAAMTVSAQEMRPIGQSDTRPIIDAAANNVINMNRTVILGRGSSAGSRKVERERVGKARIESGKATTLFVPSVSGTQELAKDLSWEAHMPQDLAGQTKLIQRYVSMFNQLAAQNGYTPNDSVDGYVFAYALAYAAANDKDLNKNQLEKMRQEWRQAMLTNTYFQGDIDAHKQYTYEQNALMAMQAAEQRVKGRRAASSAERRQYEEKAQYFAGFVLNANN